MLLSLVLIVIGFVLLIKGADFLVSGASSLAKKANISELTIGLTVVALGTSAPELVVNLISSVNGHTDVVFGNIIGSNIFNIFLILGVAGVIYPLSVQKNSVWKEIPFSLAITVFLFFVLNDRMIIGGDFNRLSQIEGLLLLVLFVGFMVYVIANSTNTMEQEEIDPIPSFSNTKNGLLITGGLVGLVIGGKMVVDNAVTIAEYYQVSQKMIGLTIIAAGTSLPELATSAVAAFKKRSDIAVGNVIGSNIFNILFVLAISSTIKPLNFDTALNIDIYVLLIGTTMLFLFMFTLAKKRLDRWEAALFLVGFFIYMVYLFIRK
ncbi:calcium/sodium antiporter [Cytophagales bacterium LB-30]|uniref:Calcium/sodium antiporter n=1 Tax=Shiella aurantiaca TaxID=3058365 RepID=A0ABT8F882_9BACT|nr:calcium/sodium antiporter [Shiella aurantiaca]